MKVPLFTKMMSFVILEQNLPGSRLICDYACYALNRRKGCHHETDKFNPVPYAAYWKLRVSTSL
ncbi:MAG TPA: hypothetical protein VKE92_02670, partial [Anaerolineales bacterium]|nr:hypothetical protein [Anaerolineales bacterium]